jgi:hypothetical protein
MKLLSSMDAVVKRRLVDAHLEGGESMADCG